MFFYKNLNIQDGIFNLSRIVYRVKNGNMDLLPFKGKHSVETTPLFRVLFFNMTGSNVCLELFTEKTTEYGFTFPT